MPSKSRKKIKGQARKAKANAAAANEYSQVEILLDGQGREHTNVLSTSLCYHGQNKTPNVCVQFVTSFIRSYLENSRRNKVVANAANGALSEAYNKFPEAVNNENYLDISKRILIGNGTSYLLGRSGPDCTQFMSMGCAAALMYIDSYSPSSHISSGNLDLQDPKEMMKNLDILTTGCRRSLVKYFRNEIPCKCLDEMYSLLKSTTPKIGLCRGCKQKKDRNTLYVCTGCERTVYCSKACQIASAPKHKKVCKFWQRHDLALLSILEEEE